MQLFVIEDARNPARKCGPYSREEAERSARELNAFVAKAGITSSPFRVRPRNCNCNTDVCDWGCRAF